MTLDELDCLLVTLAGEERAGLRRFLEHLIDFDDQRGAEQKAYPSLYAYCRERLKLSEGEAYRRIHVSRKAKMFPEILDHIERGTLTLSSLSVLVPHLAVANVTDLLDKARGKSKRDVESLVAGFAAEPAPLRDVIRVLSAPMPEKGGKETGADTLGLAFEGRVSARGPAAPRLESPPQVHPTAAPTPDPAIRISFTAPKSILGKLERARGLLRHKHPEGKLEAIVDEALEALLDRLDRDRKAKPAPPREVLPDRRRIPEWVKDAVWKRDGGRCAFLSLEGKRCDATQWLEYDHVTPYALGGRSDDPENVRLLCRAHNQLRARGVFGDWNEERDDPAEAAC